ncbi:unnamed protein product [marine sediment metagenome]|uniref:Uncharacterized protein n=1 Tax=marine sediment metagenome TaxID=412755 RepID=X1ACG6_9ZZZZ
MSLLCKNCGEGKDFLVRGHPVLPDGFYCEYCLYLVAKFVRAGEGVNQ